MSWSHSVLPALAVLKFWSWQIGIKLDARPYLPHQSEPHTWV